MGLRPVKERLKLGKIGYLNVLPVYYPLESGAVAHSFDIVAGTPARLNRLMAQGRLDVSAISSIEYARHPERYFIVPDLSISCRGPVRSVLLLSRVPVEKLDGRTVLLTAQSHTSQALLRILFARRLGLEASFQEGRLREQFQEGGRPQAFLAIGNEALCLSHHPDYPYCLDLGRAWHEWTGLPFVFGLWAVQRAAVEAWNGRLESGLSQLAAAKEWGAGHRSEICRVAEAQGILDCRRLEDYYRRLGFDLGQGEMEGLSRFFRYLHEAGEIDRVPPLEFYSPLASVA